MRVPFPIGGLSEGRAAIEQPLQTSFSLQNVRAFDISDERVRGGQRPGTALAYTTRIVGDYPIIAMAEIVSTYITSA